MINTIVNTIGATITSVENAPLTLHGIKFSDRFKSLNHTKKKIIDQYTVSFKSQIFKLLFSIDLIGSPVALMRSFQTGAIDLFTKPLEGFVQGPLEGASGIIEGSLSLVSHTTTGVMTSV